MGYIPNKVQKAEKRMEVSPYDTEAWSVLVRDSQVSIDCSEQAEDQVHHNPPFSHSMGIIK